MNLRKLPSTLVLIVISSQLYSQAIISTPNNNVGVILGSPDAIPVAGDANSYWASPLIYRSKRVTGSSFPFNQYGEMMIQGTSHGPTYNKGISFLTWDGSSNPAAIRMRIDQNGMIGIGTISPNSKLEVYNTATSGHLLLSANDNPTADGTRIDVDFMVANNDHLVGRIASNYTNSANGGSGGLRFFTRNSGDLSERLRILPNGNVAVGTTSTGTHKLAVDGTIGARGVKVEATGWSDFVFENNYELRSLEETEQYISKNKHLPEIPSEAEVIENGINLGDMDAKLLQKVEELTLYLIEQNKRMNRLETKNTELEKEISALKNK